MLFEGIMRIERASNSTRSYVSLRLLICLCIARHCVSVVLVVPLWLTGALVEQLTWHSLALNLTQR